MARYIKANVKVTEYLKLTKDRNQVKDGNYLLWQSDMLAFGRLTELPRILARIGGLALQAHEAREEQDGTVSRKLPAAADPQFAAEEVLERQPEQDGAEEAGNPEPAEDTAETGATDDNVEAAEAESANEEETTDSGTGERKPKL